MPAVDAARAQALVGVPFRSQGRDPRQGLDCVGLCIAVFGIRTGEVRRDYRLRGDHAQEVKAFMLSRFRRVSAGLKRPGDLLVLAVADDQLHLAVLTARGFVHADARLRRVVETPGEPQWPVVGVYRRRSHRRAGR